MVTNGGRRLQCAARAVEAEGSFCTGVCSVWLSLPQETALRDKLPFQILDIIGIIIVHFVLIKGGVYFIL